MFACEHEDVRPDIMALAKGLSGGYLPLAATLATDRIYDAFLGKFTDYRTFFHGHSYTGNALACAAANACLDIFERDAVIEKIQPKIKLLAELLAREIEPLTHVGEIRQCGMMVGVDLLESVGASQAYPQELSMGARVCLTARGYGVILRPLGDTAVLMPPLSITEDELTAIVNALKTSIIYECGK
jgi:adenosylmethionine-8-amino-7-oxononanoate aminotransferase